MRQVENRCWNKKTKQVHVAKPVRIGLPGTGKNIVKYV